MATLSTLMDADRGELARLVSELMSSRGMTQTELARASGVSQTHISRILSGENMPSTEVLNQLAEAFGVDPSYLHRAYAVTIGLRLEAKAVEMEGTAAWLAAWDELPPEQRAAQLAAVKAILEALRKPEK